MIYSIALDPRFKKYAVQLCSLSRGEEYVWGVVKDTATRHKRFEKVSAADPVEVEVPDSLYCSHHLRESRRDFLALYQHLWMKELQVQAVLCSMIHLLTISAC